MTVEILRSDTAALPAAERAAELLASSGETLSLACTDGEMKSAYTVLRTVMDHGYAHDSPALVRLVCADEAVYKTYRFQWNMWYAERKPDEEE